MSRQLQILLIEENESDVALLQRALENSRLLAQYVVVKTAIKMRETLQQKGRPCEWLITVKDNGIGIDEKFSDKIFIMFQRIYNKDEYSGTGIGLAVK